MQSSSASAAPTAKPFHDDEMPSAARLTGASRTGSINFTDTLQPWKSTAYEWPAGTPDRIRTATPGPLESSWIHRRRAGLTTCRADDVLG